MTSLETGARLRIRKGLDTRVKFEMILLSSFAVSVEDSSYLRPSRREAINNCVPLSAVKGRSRIQIVSNMNPIPSM